ncbi:MAG: two-component system NtrC family nitrogen regulation response regulator NtrX [Rhodospirillaceae bacterium]|nr:MAG: two-component system NtrC family nitrogen regulation response regulator NtrX [Rhodospirillaceae bacterium]
MAYDILIVDDEADIRMLITGILEDEGYEAREARDSDSALQAIQARRPSLVVLDIWLQGSRLDGLQILDRIKYDHPHVPVVMISGHGTIETAVAAIQKGAYDFIEKPFKTDRLLLVVQRAIETARLRNENEELKLRGGAQTELIGASSAIVQLRQIIERVAPTGSRLLITGPPGCGKEVVARLVHIHSHRAENPFVVINCAAMHPDRVEAELFGVERSHPDQPRKTGTFEQAHGGTLLLDEVTDMPLATQSKIIRALQEQTFERVGGDVRVSIDVRVIATTNRDLHAEIQAGRFREDLFYRLNVVPIRIPALRDLREDIPVLAEYFMQKAAQAAGLPPRPLGQDAIVALQSYDWPGNVRQLRNTMDWILIMAPGEMREPVRADMLPPEVGTVAPHVWWEKGGELMTIPLREAREVFERKYLLAQITRFSGNVSRTAAFVGMERSALHRKLRSLGLITDDKSRS